MPPHFEVRKEPPRFKGKELHRESVFEGGRSTNVIITRLKEGMLLKGANLSPRSGRGYGIAVLKKSKGPVTTFYKELSRGAELPWLEIEHKSVDAIREHITFLDGEISEARGGPKDRPKKKVFDVAQLLMHKDMLERTLTVLENMKDAGG